jgi:hypothetical protein
VALDAGAPEPYCCPVNSVSSPPADAADRDVTDAARIFHRRHGWSDAAGASFLACLLATGASGNAAENGTPAPAWFEGIVFGLGALTVICLVAMGIYSARLRRLPSAVRAQAAPLAKRHPHGRRAHHYPPRHRLTWTLRWIGMLAILLVAVVSVPAPIDGVAYLAGAERTVTFDPVSYQQNCDQYGCQTTTDGFLETGNADLSASWPDIVPLNRPIQVREPAWRWGLGQAMIDSNGTAVIAIAVSLLIEGAAVLVLILMFRLARNWRRHRQGLRQAATAPAPVA